MSAVFEPTRYKLSIDEYHKLGEVGILDEDSRVELIEGELIQMAPIGGPHMRTVIHLNRLLVSVVGTRADVSPQNPVILPPNSEPQPDFTILRLPAKGEALSVPKPDDVLLVVEVSDSTLRYDRGRKLRLYAKAGIPEVWIVDINGQCIESHRGPTGVRYKEKVIHQKGQRISVQRLPYVQIDVSEVFPVV